MDDFSLFTEAPAAMSCQHGPMRWRASLAAAEFSSHVIPTLACAAAWDLWLRHLGICPSYHENPTLHIGVN